MKNLFIAFALATVQSIDIESQEDGF